MIRTVGIISRPRPEEVARVVPPLIEWLRARQIEAICDAETSACIGPLSGQTHPREELPARADLIIVLGGDGTLLAAARLVGDHPVPVLAVNLGGLGFLTSVPQDELYTILEKILQGQHWVSERVLLEAEIIRDGEVIRRQRALNDAVLNKGAMSRIMDLELRVDDTYVTTYKADGLIISTPTGSTAYSLAAGGPIIYPRVAAFIVTPICPHTLTNRPLVIPDNSKIEVDFQPGEEPVYLTLDGQIGIELRRGDRVVVNKAASKLQLVRPARHTYYEILRNKLKWGER